MGGPRRRRPVPPPSPSPPSLPPTPTPTLEPKNPDPIKATAALAILATVFAVYASTAFPSFAGGDSGELVVTACELSVAHPPGYPTFTILGAIAIRVGRLFGENPARAMNLLAALQGAGAALCIFYSVEELTGNLIAAATSSLTMAFSSTMWLYNIQAEVFALNNFLCALLIFLTLKYFGKETEEQAEKLAYLGAFVCGLAATNQHTTVFYLVPLVLSVLLENPGFWFQTKRLGLLTTALLLGISPYIHLPIASFRKAKESWGYHLDLDGLLKHLLRREYGTFQLASSELSSKVSLEEKLMVYGSNLAHESLFITPILAIFGALVVLRALPSLNSKSRRAVLGARVLISSYVLYILVFHMLANLDFSPLYLGVQMRFWMQPNLIVFTLAGVGIHWILSLLPISSQTSKRLVGIFLLITAVQLQLFRNYERRNHSTDSLFRTYGYSSLSNLPPRSIVFVNGDLNHNAFKYLYHCEGLRNNDVDILSLQLMSWPWFQHQRLHYPNITFPNQHYNPYLSDGFSLQGLIDANPGRPKFLCGAFKDGDHSTEGRVELFPVGYCHKLVRAGEISKWSRSQLLRLLQQSEISLPSIEDLGPFNSKRYTSESWERVVYRDTAAATQTLFARVTDLLGSIQTEISSITPNQRTSTKGKILSLAVRVSDKYAGFLNQPDLVDLSTIDTGILRNMGIFYGLAVRIYPDEKSTLESKMFHWWQIYLKFSPHDSAIASFLQNRHNPYNTLHHHS